MKENKKYQINHSRKGNFSLLVNKINGEWITGIIIKGTASAIMDYNVREKGEEITVRECLITSYKEII